LFDRPEFDYVVRYLLDEEEKGIRMAHDRFQEWKNRRDAQSRKIAEEKKKRRQQLDLLKAARERQQKLWENFHKVGGGGGLMPSGAAPASLTGLTLTQGANFPELDPRMRTLATTEDLKRMQEAGALEIEEDTTAGTLHMRFTPEMTAQMMAGTINPTAAVAAAIGKATQKKAPKTTKRGDQKQAAAEPPTPSELLIEDDGDEITIVESCASL